MALASAADLAIGEKIYGTSCLSCHGAAVLGAPKLGDKPSWTPRLAKGVAVLHAVAGMVPPGAETLDPALHTVHSLVAVEDEGRWKIAVLQSTPARYGGRAETLSALTAELEAAR